MIETNLNALVDEFSQGAHGNTDYYKDAVFILGADKGSYAPLGFILKSFENMTLSSLQKEGYILESLDLIEVDNFKPWFENQFSRKLSRKAQREISILHRPDNKMIFDTIETVNKCYETLRSTNILLNSEKLPTQVGEWYCKCIFGLKQKKSSSQRGFDFYFEDKRVEVKVHWGDVSSPKGVKLRKSLVELSDYTVIIYVGQNLMIREICFLDSDFVIRKFSGKGHTLFLKDSEMLSYFFSRSDKHYRKVINKNSLLRYCNPTLAMKIAEKIQA